MAFKNIIAIVFLIAATAIMLKLGFWQLQRLEWKEAIIADIEAQEAVDPTQTPLDLETADNFAMGYIDGTFNPNMISIQPRTKDGQVGQHIYSVIQTAQGQNLAVNFGWLRAGETPTVADLYLERFIGYLREPDKPNAFTPSNDPANNKWYGFDEESFKRYFNVDNLNDKVLYATYPLSVRNVQPFEGLPRPRNKHAQYATFWFGMSGLLLFLSGFYAWRQRK